MRSCQEPSRICNVDQKTTIQNTTVDGADDDDDGWYGMDIEFLPASCLLRHYFSSDIRRVEIKLSPFLFSFFNTTPFRSSLDARRAFCVHVTVPFRNKEVAHLFLVTTKSVVGTK